MSRLLPALLVLLAGMATFAWGVLRTPGRPPPFAAGSPTAKPSAECDATAPPLRRRARPELAVRPSPRRSPGEFSSHFIPHTPRSGERGPYTFVVLGPGDVPLEGVKVRRDSAPPELGEQTDANGEAIVVPFVSRLRPRVRIHGIVPTRFVVADAPRIVVRYPDLVPLRVRFVDALGSGVVRGGRVRLRGATAGEDWLPREGAAFVAFPGPIERGARTDVDLVVEPPPGYAGAPLRRVRTVVSPLADRVVVNVPVWPAGSVVVRVANHEGSPVTGAGVRLDPLLGDGDVHRSGLTDAGGVCTIENVPMVPGERLTLSAGAGGRVGHVTSSALTIGTLRVELDVRLPAELSGRRSRRTLSAFGCGGGGSAGPMPEGGTSRLDVRVVLRDGRPARGVRVRLCGWTPADDDSRQSRWLSETWRTDAEGRTAIDHVVPGNVELFAWAPGMTPIRREVRIDGDALELSLHEPAGAFTRIRVVTPDGHPVASAEVDVECRTWLFDAKWTYAEIVAGTQSATLLTDRDGRIDLTNVAHVSIAIDARLGSREGDATAEPGDDVTIVLE